MLMDCFNSKAQLYECLCKCLFHNSLFHIPLYLLNSPHIPIVNFIIIPILRNNKRHLPHNLLQHILHNILTNIFLQQLICNLFEQWLKQLILFYPLVNHKQFPPFHSLLLDRILAYFAQFRLQQFLQSIIQQ